LESGSSNHAVLAEQLYILVEGAIVAAQIYGEPWPAEYASQAARSLVFATLLTP
jgi:hypothetical protein